MGRELACVFPERSRRWKRPRRTGGAARRSAITLPRPGAPPVDPEAELRATDAAQPALGAVSLAMLKILARFGVVPDATAGHSFGELTALCAAGWIQEADLHALAAARGAAMAAAAPAPCWPCAPPGEIERLLAEEAPAVVLANRNGPEQECCPGRARRWRTPPNAAAPRVRP